MSPKKHSKILFAYLIPFCVGAIICCIPRPETLDNQAWSLLALFVSTIVALITKPLPMGGIALVSLAIATACKILPMNEALSGFSSCVTWLILFVFCIARAMIKAHLSTRAAYLLISVFGGHTLTLSYVLTFTELLICPVIPSAAARAGGMIYPVLLSITDNCGANKDTQGYKSFGGFLAYNAYHTNYITSAMFLTAMAANLMIQQIALDQGIEITWAAWAKAAILPGFVSLLVVPYISYIFMKPKITAIPNAKALAKKHLQDLGKMQHQEYIVLIVFGLMLFLWIFGDNFGINPTVTALLGLVLLLVSQIITTSDILHESEAWHNFLWLSVLMALSQAMQKYKIIAWFSAILSSHIGHFSAYHGLIILTLVYFYSHYFFASMTSHISAMYSTCLALAVMLGAPPLFSALLLAFASNLFATLTHYGSTGAVIFFGSNFISIKRWWGVGLIISFVHIIIWGGLGVAWWKMIGLIPT
ncbi:putative anion transporter [Rickettsiales endosymbiont of Paramecium tredecaurelia]|uniref:DASS family sodium-coupled anion symporter n=1 Tax=Candidatus Sarmatiella mevalonica TaxID=2770581 RepID=UPI00192439C2|nr:DASS family sodium-coupled anion symporter [Candidatus Sarmatiella mevalonica]MBL3284758.1 putative anion transporter [Candidatus Sarmatiella mevalonica]